MFTCHPKYPVARLGDEAGDQEKIAKGFKVGGELAKNAITVFDHTLSWQRFQEMMSFAERLDQHVPDAHKDGTIRRSLLQHLMQVIRAAFEAEESKKRENALNPPLEQQNKNTSPDGKEDHFEFYRNVGRLHALLVRRGYWGKSEDAESAAAIAQELLQNMTQFERFADFVVPLQFVLYKTRS